MTRQRFFPAVFIAGFILAGTTSLSHAAWPTDPTANLPLCTAADCQQSPTIVSDGAGGAISDSRAGLLTHADCRRGSVLVRER